MSNLTLTSNGSTIFFLFKLFNFLTKNVNVQQSLWQ